MLVRHWVLGNRDIFIERPPYRAKDLAGLTPAQFNAAIKFNYVIIVKRSGAITYRAGFNTLGEVKTAIITAIRNVFPNVTEEQIRRRLFMLKHMKDNPADRYRKD
jgi:hypothetical protein